MHRVDRKKPAEQPEMPTISPIIKEANKHANMLVFETNKTPELKNIPALSLIARDSIGKSSSYSVCHVMASPPSRTFDSDKLKEARRWDGQSSLDRNRKKGTIIQ